MEVEMSHHGNEQYIESLWERVNEIQYAMIEAEGTEWDELNLELGEIEEKLAELDITLEEIEMQREFDYV